MLQEAAGKPMRRGGGSGARRGQKRRAHSGQQGGAGEAGRTGWVDGGGGIAARTSRRWRDRRGSGWAPAAKNFQLFLLRNRNFQALGEIGSNGPHVLRAFISISEFFS
jgi:hypothetical protein